MTVSAGIELCISNVFRTRNTIKKNIFEKVEKKSDFFRVVRAGGQFFWVRPAADMVILRNLKKKHFFGKILTMFKFRSRHFIKNPFWHPKTHHDPKLIHFRDPKPKFKFRDNRLAAGRPDSSRTDFKMRCHSYLLTT